MPLLKSFNRAKNNMELVASVIIPTPLTQLNPKHLDNDLTKTHHSWTSSDKRQANRSPAIHATSISPSALLLQNKQQQLHAARWKKHFKNSMTAHFMTAHAHFMTAHDRSFYYRSRLHLGFWYKSIPQTGLMNSQFPSGLSSRTPQMSLQKLWWKLMRNMEEVWIFSMVPAKCAS